MTIELTPEQQQFVEAQIAAGAFKEPRELIDAAIRLLQSRQEEYEQLRTAIEQDRHGDYAELDVDDIKARGRARLAETLLHPSYSESKSRAATTA